MIRVEDVVDRAGLEAAWRIRYEVFVVEQRVPVEEEVDALDTDPSTSHALAWLGDELVATGRVLGGHHPGEVHIGRVAVRRMARRRGVGAALMAHLEGVALARHGVPDGGDLAVRIVLSAQEQAMAFYTRLGYRVISGERYLDAGIWHQDMERRVRV
ncbi:MAG: GNAT family N-acetyltransferase [Actinomycetales bacterium]|nr:GNAT family N-acetyltransferase [Actinomycetales bacterium]